MPSSNNFWFENWPLSGADIFQDQMNMFQINEVWGYPSLDYLINLSLTLLYSSKELKELMTNNVVLKKPMIYKYLAQI